MIITAIIAGITITFVSSLVFAHAQVKQQRQWDLEDSRPSPPEPIIDSFIEGRIGVPCPKCKRPTKNEKQIKHPTLGNGYFSIEPAEGLKLAQACFSEKCPVRGKKHLHAGCYTCKTEWFMATADAKKEEQKKEEQKIE